MFGWLITQSLVGTPLQVGFKQPPPQVPMIQSPEPVL
jgi:hypothetical protein